MNITLYTDGSCFGNPGPGGYGLVLEYGEYRIIDAQEFMHTTNNRMELMGVIAGLNKIKERHIPVTVISDSEYVVKGATEWLQGWKNKGWKNSRLEPIRNKDLWECLDEMMGTFREIKFEWIKSHDGHYWNEYCDELAREAAGIAKEKSESLVNG